MLKLLLLNDMANGELALPVYQAEGMAGRHHLTKQKINIIR